MDAAIYQKVTRHAENDQQVEARIEQIVVEQVVEEANGRVHGPAGCENSASAISPNCFGVSASVERTLLSVAFDLDFDLDLDPDSDPDSSATAHKVIPPMSIVPLPGLVILKRQPYRR